MKPWKTLESRYLLKRRWMNLREDRVRLPDGAELEEFHVLEFPDWACVIPFAETGEVVMTKQYRHGVGRMSLEFPAGAVDAGEAPLASAQRELLEETGFAAEAWTFLGQCAPDPSRHTHQAFLYIARGARRVQAQRLDRGEQIDVRLLAPAEVVRRAERGEIFHGTHLMALFWARLQGQWTGEETG